jgi:hypothetical protein
MLISWPTCVTRLLPEKILDSGSDFPVVDLGPFLLEISRNCVMRVVIGTMLQVQNPLGELSCAKCTVYFASGKGTLEISLIFMIRELSRNK